MFTFMMIHVSSSIVCHINKYNVVCIPRINRIKHPIPLDPIFYCSHLSLDSVFQSSVLRISGTGSSLSGPFLSSLVSHIRRIILAIIWAHEDDSTHSTIRVRPTYIRGGWEAPLGVSPPLGQFSLESVKNPSSRVAEAAVCQMALIP